MPVPIGQHGPFTLLIKILHADFVLFRFLALFTSFSIFNIAEIMTHVGLVREICVLCWEYRLFRFALFSQAYICGYIC